MSPAFRPSFIRPAEVTESEHTVERDYLAEIADSLQRISDAMTVPDGPKTTAVPDGTGDYRANLGALLRDQLDQRRALWPELCRDWRCSARPHRPGDEDGPDGGDRSGHRDRVPVKPCEPIYPHSDETDPATFRLRSMR